MDIRATLREKQKRKFRRMSHGKRLELAVKLSEFVLKLKGQIRGAWKESSGR